jgi:3-oxoacyl-[acyl-carrier protein] reductase
VFSGLGRATLLVMDLGLQEKVFLVTAATSGFGLATAGMLLAEGACVVISSPTRHSVDQVAARLGQDDRTVGIAVDSADPAAADRLITAALTHFGRLDGGLLSIGGSCAGTLTAVSDQRWHGSFEPGFPAAVRLVRTTAPVLPAAAAIGLVRPLPPGPQRSVSVLSRLRSGLAIVVEMLAEELEPQGIRVNGLIAGRCGTSHGFARAATFVLSPAAAYLTGNVITIDGEARRGHLAGVF